MRDAPTSQFEVRNEGGGLFVGGELLARRGTVVGRPAAVVGLLVGSAVGMAVVVLEAQTLLGLG